MDAPLFGCLDLFCDFVGTEEAMDQHQESERHLGRMCLYCDQLLEIL